MLNKSNMCPYSSDFVRTQLFDIDAKHRAFRLNDGKIPVGERSKIVFVCHKFVMKEGWYKKLKEEVFKKLKS